MRQTTTSAQSAQNTQNVINNRRTVSDEVRTEICISFEHDGRMTPQEARDYVKARVMSYAEAHAHTIDEGTQIIQVEDMGEPEPTPARQTFAEAAAEEVADRYQNGDTTFTAAVSIAEAISRAVVATHGKGNTARYMLDQIAYYVQGHCNAALSEDEDEE